MGQLYVDTIEPQSGTVLTVGESGQNTVLAGNDLRANIFQDDGGNAIFTSNGSGTLSSVDSAFGNGEVLLNTQTASNSTNLTFSSTLITSTYKEYIWRWHSINAATDSGTFQIGFSSDNGTGYGILKITSYYRGQNSEGGSTGFGTQVFGSKASTDAQPVSGDLGNDTEYCTAGEFHLYDPANTTGYKCWWSTSPHNHASQYANLSYAGGFIKTTSAINNLKFYMASGDITAGQVKMYGVK